MVYLHGAQKVESVKGGAANVCGLAHCVKQSTFRSKTQAYQPELEGNGHLEALPSIIDPHNPEI